MHSSMLSVMKLLILLVASLSALSTCAGHRILALVPMPAKSHANLFERLVIELANKGHDVTYLSAFEITKPVPNLKQIVVPNLHYLLGPQTGKTGEEINMFQFRHLTPWAALVTMPAMGQRMCSALLQLPQLSELILSNQHFDLIIGEAFLDEGLLGGFSQKFKAPIIGVATFMPNIWTNLMVGNPAPMSYIPDPMLGFQSKMTFWQRMHNVLYSLVNEAMHNFHHLRMQDSLMREHFGEDLPPLKDIMKNVSLVFVNHHHSLAFPRPYVPNMIEIGGYHINPPKELPKDLKQYFDNSKDGFILFSMGSNLKSAMLPDNLKKTFLNVFAKLKQNVIWKFEDDSLKDLPKNVKVSKWLPQSDILAHPNIKLFITHGGLLSTTEAVHRGVPVVGIPVFGDQPLNMQITENAGLGKKLNFDDITEETLHAAISEIINNPSYMKTAKLRSELLRDTPLSALDTALYWIDYVVRHKGAPHLRSAAQDLCWPQLYLFDVFAVLGVASLLVMYLQFKVAACLFRKFWGKKPVRASKTKKNK